MLYVRREFLRWFVMVFVLVMAIVFSVKLFKFTEISLDGQKGDKLGNSAPQIPCGLLQPCPEKHFSFKMASGVANVIGPKICFNGQILVGGKTKISGPGLNIAVVSVFQPKVKYCLDTEFKYGNTEDYRLKQQFSGMADIKKVLSSNARRMSWTPVSALMMKVLVDGSLTGDLINADFFDMWSGDVASLVKYLRSIQNDSLVLIASFDDPATRLNNDARTLIRQLGSSHISNLAFRDSWVFVGGKGINHLKPLEKFIKNEKSVNKYDSWPQMLEMEGCVPQKQD